MKALIFLTDSNSSNVIKINAEVFAVVFSASLIGLVSLFAWLVKQVIKMGQIMVRLEDRIVALERGTQPPHPGHPA